MTSVHLPRADHFFIVGRTVRCPKCPGTKVEQFEDYRDCPGCNGTGLSKRKYFPCFSCKGTGQSHDYRHEPCQCHRCRGTGAFSPECARCGGKRQIPYLKSVKSACPRCGGTGDIGLVKAVAEFGDCTYIADLLAFMEQLTATGSAVSLMQAESVLTFMREIWDEARALVPERHDTIFGPKDGNLRARGRKAVVKMFEAKQILNRQSQVPQGTREEKAKWRLDQLQHEQQLRDEVKEVADYLKQFEQWH